MATLTAYVSKKEGSYQEVTAYDMAEWVLQDYSDTYYRDGFSVTLGEAGTTDDQTFAHPDGSTFDPPPSSSFSQEATSYLPDNVSHTAPRDLLYKKSILRFLKREIVESATEVFEIVAGYLTFADATYAHKARDGMTVSYDGTRYFIVQTTGNGFGLSATEGGALAAINGSGNALTIAFSYPIAEFFAEDIDGYSNTAPIFP